VSSSKNLSNPALAAGIGASRFRLFSRAPDNYCSQFEGSGKEIKVSQIVTDRRISMPG
jgi:hypothetical protein